MQNKLYFPGLHGIRFFAAFFVIIGHIELFRQIHNLPNINLLLGSLSQNGVDIFFTLSGFLITYLLLKEQQLNHSVSIKNFYIRRVLRIWPLYFLIFIIGITILPLWSEHDFNNKITISFLYVFFLPHLAKTLFIMNYAIVILWSIGVEENFYLFFPWFFRANKKRFLQAILISIFILLIIKFITTYAAFQNISYKSFFGITSNFLAHLRFENMFIGAIAAYLHFNKSKLIQFTQSVYIVIISICLLLLFSFIPIEEFTNFIGIDPIFAYILHPSIHAILTSFIILYSIQEKVFNNFLENKTIRYLGKISYGLYVFHPIVLILLYMLPKRINNFNWGLQYVFVICFSIILSSISYTYFETWFLKRKNKFSVIISGNNSN